MRGFARAGLGDDVALVLAGGSGWDDDLDGAVAEAKEMGADVLRPGFLPQEALSGYLGGADVVAYPSHGEGFGLPVLEAMACGAAVLTTPHLALPEVGGDAVAYTETGPDEIARALHDLLLDDAAADRARRPGAAAGRRVHVVGGRRCPPRRVPPRRAARP